MSEAAEQVEQEVVIVNRQGLHARPVMKFVDLAMRFKCDIKVRNGEQQVDGKSPMEMMLLIGTPGSRLLLRASGPDARPAVDALAQLINSKFGED